MRIKSIPRPDFSKPFNPASDEILKAIRENMAKLDACISHNFQRKSETGRDAFKCVCANCGGVVDAVNARYYELGRKHGVTN